MRRLAPQDRTSMARRPKAGSSAASEDARWLLLIHQIPPKPAYLRVKIWRRIQRLGAVAIKNSVYVLPQTDQANEDLQWVLREIVEGGGDGTVCEARFVDGLTDAQVKALFHAARDAEYARIAEEARALERELRPALAKPERRLLVAAELTRLQRRFAECTSLDFFAAKGRQAAEELLLALEERMTGSDPSRGKGGASQGPSVRGRTWVTRKGVHIDRIASAWLIRRFIDAKARFKLVAPKGYQPEPHELRFDMFDAEFTHEGDRCTFEVLIARFALAEPGLRAIAEIVHDIDLKDMKFGRPETAGIDHLIAGVAMAHKDDDDRLARGSAIFDDLYEYLKRKSS
jgi:hypothetical protein